MLRLLLAALLVVLLLAGLAGGYVLYREHQGRDIRGSSTEFTLTTEAQQPQPPAAATTTAVWPMYGFGPDRTRAVGFRIRPPFRRVWRWYGGSLLEFPPAIGYGRLFVSTNAGRVYAVYVRTGKDRWIFRVRRCTAASPALDRRTVFVAFMNRPPCNARGGKGLDGEVVALAARDGKVRWRTRIGPSESSPLVANGRVYVGDWRGNEYALDERTGRIRWTFHTRGAIKAGAALAGHRLFVGSYDGHVYCLDARSGRLIWRAAAQPRFGHTGQFYATPAVAYSRVYVGATDGKVYSFGATSGKLRWSHSTGGYVYSAPAVWNGLVFAGSYSGTFFAFDAATGDVRWRFRANGPISGAATVIDGVVWFATLKQRTYALAAATGKLLYQYPEGQYTPAVADAKRLYLVGFARITAMEPIR
jgi:outer membrane protein assembly factor BamB